MALGPDSQFRTTLGFTIWTISTVVAVVMAYASLRSELTAALTEAHRASTIISSQGDLITLIRMEQGRTQQKLDDFRESYERDMRRYIRETPNK